jgi:hypothetical protein
MRLKDICESFARANAPTLRLPAIAATEGLAQRLALLTEQGQTEKRPTENFDLIVRRIDAALAKGEPLSRKDLRLAPWCIWNSERPLAEIPGRLDVLLDRIAAAGRRKIYRTLAAVYLQLFHPTRVGCSAVAGFLVRHVEELGPPWIEAHRTLQLFSPAAGPRALAERALSAGRTPEEILSLSKIPNPSSHVGFCQYAYQLGYAKLEASANGDPMRRLATIKAWAFNGGKVRFDSLRVAAVNAAIIPFGSALPEKPTRDAFLGFALSLLADPRINRSRWTNCVNTEQTVRRWLTEQSLRQFFDVVDRVAAEEHWKFRRAFWSALYEKGYIDEAWVVFEINGSDEARRMFGNDISFARFGPNAAVQKGHSVLLLRIGTLIVAEWSHSSPCSIWDESHGERGPGLYKHSYNRDELRKPFKGDTSVDNLAKQGVFWHRSPGTYAWQNQIASFLRTRRNIFLTSADFRVRQ